MNVLIVESRSELGAIWCRHLERMGMCVHQVADQSAAVTYLEDNAPEIILLDLVLREGSALATVPDNLDAIARIEDRRLALVTLAQSALICAVRENGLLLQRSWTARDAMRRLPQDMSHRHALRDLVTAGERVLFGGRDVSEADFQDHVDQIRPLFADAAR